jgi:hypothetical protein
MLWIMAGPKEGVSKYINLFKGVVKLWQKPLWK